MDGQGVQDFSFAPMLSPLPLYRNDIFIEEIILSLAGLSEGFLHHKQNLTQAVRFNLESS